MRSADVTQSEIFSYRILDQRIPASHPLQNLRVLVDGILSTLHADFAVLHAKTGRPSIPPERLLRASLIQTLYSIRSERQLVQHIDYNLLYRWFVCLDMDHKVWDHSSFTKNRDRLLNETVARAFFVKVLGLAQWHGLISSEHFSVDGTLIEAWASAKSFKAKDGSGKPPEGGGRNATVDFTGEERKNDTHASTTDPDARLFKKSKGDKSQFCLMGHALMGNRNGLAVDVETTLATSKAEREAATVMAKRSLKRGSTRGADKNYDTAGFVKTMRQLGTSPHVAQKTNGAIDARTTPHAGYGISLRLRKRNEEIFGWAKTVGDLRKTCFIGLAKVKAQTTFTLAAYNLTRMATIFGRRLNTV